MEDLNPWAAMHRYVFIGSLANQGHRRLSLVVLAAAGAVRPLALLRGPWLAGMAWSSRFNLLEMRCWFRLILPGKEEDQCTMPSDRSAKLGRAWKERRRGVWQVSVRQAGSLGSWGNCG